MTTLEACNIVLMAMGLPPATALDGSGSSGTSDVAEAQRFVEQELRHILSLGWGCNTYRDQYLIPSTEKIAISGTPAFVLGEVITESVSNATGSYMGYTSGFLYVARSGTTAFTGGQTLTGETGPTISGSTRTALSGKTIPTSDDWLTVCSTQYESTLIARRGSILFNITDNSPTFTGPVCTNVTITLPIDSLSQALSQYVAYSAAMKFQRYKKRSGAEDNQIEQQLLVAKVEAEQEEQDTVQSRTTETREARAIRGRPSNAYPDENYA